MFDKIKSFFTDVGLFMQCIVNYILLIPVYLLGVGTAKLFSEMYGKEHIQSKSEEDSSFFEFDNEDNITRMF